MAGTAVTGWAAVWAAVAMALLVPGRRRARRVDVVVRRRRNRWPWMAAAALGILAAVIVAGLAGMALVVSAGTVAAVGWRRWRQRQEATDRAAVAEACAELSAQLGLGKVPRAALVAVAGAGGVLASAAAMQKVGGDAADVWEQEADAPGHEAKLTLARAWRVSQRTGAPMRDSIRALAEHVRHEHEHRQAVDAELAAPRMSTFILSMLPLLGVAMSSLLGGDPLAFLFGTLPGQCCLLASSLLASVGVWWSEQQLARTLRRAV